MGERADERVSIAEVSSLLGIPVPTIRSWERRYAFPSPARTGGRHRRYSVAEIDALRAMRDEMIRGHRAGEAVAIARAALTMTPARSDALEGFARGADELDGEVIRRSLDEATEVLGVERTIVDVAFPGLREIGERWKAGRCDVSNEHLATHVVRPWLARVTTFAPPPYRAHPIVLACAPTELHTMGLEAFAVVLARRGWACRFLGSTTPVDSVVLAVRSARAAGAVVTAHRSVARRGAVEALRAVSDIPGVGAFYGGNAFATERSRTDVPGTYLGADLLHAADVITATLERSASS